MNGQVNILTALFGGAIVAAFTGIMVWYGESQGLGATVEEKDSWVERWMEERDRSQDTRARGVDVRLQEYETRISRLESIMMETESGD